MTSNTYNIAQKTTIVTIMSVMLLSPFVSFAQERDDSKFCKNLDRIENALMQRLSTRVDDARDKHSDQVDRYTTLKTERIASLEDRRNDTDSRWEDRINNLKDGATEEELIAIDIFVGTVETLALERRVSVNDAIAIFEEAVKDLRDERTAAFNDMLERYKNAIEDAFDEAERACDAGEDPTEIRAELRSDITALREAFKAERAGYDYRAAYRELRDQRRVAIQEAKEIFQNGFLRAKEILKEAFGQ